METMIRKFIKAILLIVFIGSFSMLAYKQFQNMKAKNAYEQAESLANATTEAVTEVSTEMTTEDLTEAMTEETTPEETKPKVWQAALLEEEDPFLDELAQKNLEALREVNSDVLGWIEIPGTQLAYPIMDGEDNEYYLNHTWDKKSSSAGSIFLEQYSNSDLKDFNTILYGHRMMNGSMFGSLKHYNQQSYFEEHPYVYILDDSGVFRYDIFSAYTAPVNEKTYQYGFRSEEQMQAFLDYCVSKSEIDTGIVPTTNDKIITLVTCTGRGYDARWVVQIRLKGVEDNPLRLYGVEENVPETAEGALETSEKKTEMKTE